MADENKDPADEGSDEVKKVTPPAGNGSKLLLIMAIVNVVALLALAVAFLTKKEEPRTIDEVVNQDPSLAGTAPAVTAAASGAAVDLFVVESFTVSLSGSSGTRYVQADISIEASDEFAKEQLLKHKPKIRDFIINTLSGKSFTQLDSADARDFLREEIRNKLNGYLTRGEVKAVFFTKFILQ